MIYTGGGPLVILFWSGGERPGHIRFAKYAAYTGIVAALAGIAYVVLFGHSGLQSDDATLRTGTLIACTRRRLDHCQPRQRATIQR